MARYRTVLAVALGAAAIAVAAADLEIVEVMPDKLLYETGQPVHVDVTVKNPTEAERSATLIVRLEWEIDEGAEVGKKQLRLAPGQEEVVRLAWGSREVLGAGAYATLERDGKVIDQAKEFFNVVDADDALRVSQHSTDRSSTPWQKSNTYDRDNYCNVIEIWAWGGSPGHWLHEDRYFIHGYRWVEKDNLRKLVNNPLGKRVMAYAISYALRGREENLYVQHPEWFMADENGWGHYSLGMASVDRSLRRPREWQYYLYTGGSSFGGQPDYLQPEVLAWYYDCAEYSTKEMGWHGIRWDGHPQIFHTDSKDHYRYDGKRYSREQKQHFNDKVTVAHLKARTGKIKPTWLNYFNCEPALREELPDGFEQIVSGGCVAGSEVTRHATSAGNPYHRWRDMYEIFSEAAHRCRKHGGFYSAIYTPPFTVKAPENSRIGYAMMNAIGVQAWAAGISEDPKRFGDHRSMIVPYLKASTRYSAMSWGHGMETVRDATEWIAVEAPGDREVWWDRSVRRRPSLGGKQLLILGLVNPPPTEFNVGADQKLPEPVEDVAVIVRPRRGKVLRAWDIQAFPDTERRELPLAAADGGSRIVLPRIECSRLLVVELSE